MVQFYRGSPSPKDAAWGQLATALGKNLGHGITTYQANQTLQDLLKDPAFKDAPISAKMGELQTRMSRYGDVGKEVIQNQMMVEAQQEQERLQKQDVKKGNVLRRILEGEKVSQAERDLFTQEEELAIAQHQLKTMDTQKRKQAAKSVHDALIKAEYPEETAELWQTQMENAPVGGQTDVIKQVNNLITRSKTGKGHETPEKVEETKPKIEIPGIETEALELDFPELPEPIGLTPADTVRQNEHREKINIPVYTETVDRLNALDEEYRDIAYLQELNEIPGALPTGIEKWNINWDTGDIRFKALASPEAQAYVKTIARMARKAKEFFPGRVTNFDLDQFKQGFPTLANSPEGRRLIAEQLATANRIAYLKDETLKAAYDHYGSGADPILVKKFATENFRRLKNELENKLKSLNQQAASMILKAETEEGNQRPSLDEIFK